MSEIDQQNYRTLGLAPGASHDAIKRAYRDLVKVWHPDRFSNDPRLQEKMEEQLKAINAAYHALIAHQTQPHTDIPKETFRKTPNVRATPPPRQQTESEAPRPNFNPRSGPRVASLNRAPYDWFFRIAKVLAVLLSLNLVRLLFVHCGIE